MWNIYEHPWAILALVPISILAIWLYRAFLPAKNNPYQWAIPLAIALAAFGIDYFVRTDNEKVRTALKQSIKAVKNENPKMLAQAIAPDYSDSFHSTKEMLMRRVNSSLTEPLVDKAITTILELDIGESTAQSVALVRIVFEKDSWPAQSYKQFVIAKVRFHFAKQPDSEWLINRIELLEVDKQTVSWGKASRHW